MLTSFPRDASPFFQMLTTSPRDADYFSSGCLFFPPRCLPFLPDTDCFSSAESLRCRSIYWCKKQKSKLCWQENYFFTKRKLSYRQQAYYSTGWSNREGRRFSPSAPPSKTFQNVNFKLHTLCLHVQFLRKIRHAALRYVTLHFYFWLQHAPIGFRVWHGE